MAQFDNLPDEIQLQIFELAAARDCQPRAVEIYFKSGEVYSKSLPPPLLHVCQLSRWVVLKRYKPWLPQFKGKPWHAPYKRMVKNHGDRVSRLNNVCVDLKKDILLVNQQQWANWDFGYLEQRHLRYLALNLSGWIHWSEAVPLLEQFRKLRRARIFDSGKHDTSANFKVSQISNWIAKKEMRCVEKGFAYSAPVINIEVVPGALIWKKKVDQWITYKYLKGYRSCNAKTQVERSIEDGRFAGMFGSSRSFASRLDRSTQTSQQSLSRSNKAMQTRIPLPAAFLNTSKTHKRDAKRSGHKRTTSQLVTLNTSFLRSSSPSSKKRKRSKDFDSEDSFLKVRKPSKTTSRRCVEHFPSRPVTVLSMEEEENYIFNRPFIMPDLEDFEPSSQESNVSLINTQEVFGPFVGDVRLDDSSMPEKAALWDELLQASWETTVDESFADMFEGIDCLRTPSPEPHNERLISSPMDLNSSPFQSPLKPSRDLGISFPSDDIYPYVGTPDVSPNFVDPRITFFDPYDEMESHVVMAPEFETTVDCQELGYLDRGNQSEFLDESSNADNLEEPDSPSQQLLHSIVQRSTPQAASSVSIATSACSPVPRNSVPVVEIWVKPSATPFTAIAEIQAVPVGMIAERLVDGNLQYLVQWDNDTRESWVAEKTVLELAPGLMEVWKSMKITLVNGDEENKPVLDDLVEKILSKKNVKGVPHYLVKWEGYPEMKDRTWEPCDRLRVDVPTLVEEYELNQKKTRKRR